MIKLYKPVSLISFYLILFLSILFPAYSAASSPPKNKDIHNFQDTLSNGTLGPIMVSIPAGKFTMGDINQVGQSYEQPLHEVIFQKTFSIGKYPITFDEYDIYTKATKQPLTNDYHWGRDSRPIINVNLSDAQAYAKWLSAETDEIYRLPSEAEWEYAARAGTKTIYTWGNKIGRNNANCNGCNSKWDRKKTAPVGFFSPNAWGIYDMLGNTWDLTADCWNFTYDNAPTDGSPWLSGDCTRGVLRGGSLGDTPQDLRSSTRLRNYSATRTVIIGFRLVRE